MEEAIPVIEKFRLAAVWQFAAKELEDYVVWAEKMRSVSKESKIVDPIGSVAGALKVAQLCKPDVLAMQGLDAGGHGWEKGAGVVSLLPEAADVLQANGLGHIPLAAGLSEIVDGRGVASALTLGAAGVVVETTVPHEKYRTAVLEARDGGQSGARAKIALEMARANG
jgi:nitronate monooxygenase